MRVNYNFVIFSHSIIVYGSPCFVRVANLKLFFLIFRKISGSQHEQNMEIDKQSHVIFWLKKRNYN